MEIKKYIEDGINSPKDIAQRIGATSAQVRKDVYQLRRKELVNNKWVPQQKRAITIHLSEAEHDKLFNFALGFNSTVLAIVTKLIKIIIRDKLFKAVLDE